VAGVLGWLGFKTIGDTQKINDRSKAVLESSTNSIKAFTSQMTEMQVKVSDLTKSVLADKTETNGVLIDRRYEQFQKIFDLIQLDYAYNYEKQIADLIRISKEAATVAPVPDDSKLLVTEMVTLTNALDKFKYALKDNGAQEFLNVIDILLPLSDDSLARDRMMTASYSHLREIAERSGRTNDAETYTSKQIYYSELAYHRAQSLDRSYLLATNNYAASLLSTGNVEDMNRAHDILVGLRKEAPQTASIWYNIGAYYARSKLFEQALSCLEQAKARGDFSSQDDIDAWNSDPDFDLLRKSDIEEFKVRIANLRDLKSTLKSEGNSCL
jgi:hypothetical protein